MRGMSRIGVILGLAATGIVGAANAAVVGVEQSLNLHDPQLALVYNISTDGQPAISTTSSYELVVDPTWTAKTKFTTFSTEPLGSPASYAIYTDTNALIEQSNTGALVDSWTVTDIPANNLAPFHLALLSAGQYVLQVTTTPGEFSISTNIASVPLPGAFWLFGAALVLFARTARRRSL